LHFSNLDCLIVLLSFATVLGIGYAAREHVATSKDFLLAGRRLPAWICGLAMAGVSLGGVELIAMGAAGARYGLASAQLFAIGAIPAMLFAGIFLMPLYYGSKARSVPEFLGMRFDQKTRVLNACLFAIMTVVSSGISLCVMGRLFEALHVFDGLFRAHGWPLQSIFPVSIVLTAVVVLAYVLLGGLAGAMYNQVLQFGLMVAGLLPLVFLALREIGGWDGLKTAVPAAYFHASQGVAHAGSNPTGIGIVGTGMALGFVLCASYWSADFRVIQFGLAAKDMESARRAPLIAAIARVFVPILMILPGMLAIGLPTPHTTTVVRTVNDVIIHETTVASPQAEQGRGLVPAKVDPVTTKIILTTGGQPLLDYDMATPSLMMRFLPTGLLGLGLSALLASFMSGMAANVTAFNTVFTYDLYQSHLNKGASDKHYLAVGRWATVGGVLLSIAMAFAVMPFNNILDVLQLVFSLVTAPLLATILLGMFWKRASAHGAFAGLLAGAVAGLLHHGLTQPIEAHPGIHGGWLAVIHQYPSDMAQNLRTALLAIGTNLLVTVVVSLCTKARAEQELVGLVYSLTPRTAPTRALWWKSRVALAVVILLVAVGMSLFFA